MEIKLIELSKHFVAKDKTVTKAVDNMNLTIPSGKLIGLLGPSGCGKSTTLYMIAGLHVPTSGHIFFGEEEVTNIPPEKRGIGLVFQNYALYPHLTVRENISFPLVNMKVSKPEAKEIVEEMARLVGLEKLLDRKPGQLSGGQQQRVAIARALAKSPRVLLLDEPLSNLDARLRLQTREEIKRIQRETGVTTVFVTHDQEEAMSISDEIVVMKDGIVQQIGKPQDVYDYPVNLFVAKFLGTPQINVFDGVLINNDVYLGDRLIHQIKVSNPQNEPQPVFVGIRPEGFEIDDKGVIEATVEYSETIGRDTSIVFSIDDTKKVYRAIVDSKHRKESGEKVRFNIREDKIFVFDVEGNLVC